MMPPFYDLVFTSYEIEQYPRGLAERLGHCTQSSLHHVAPTRAHDHITE